MMFVNENLSGKIDVKCNYYEKGLNQVGAAPPSGSQ